jgi:hypothetical protein
MVKPVIIFLGPSLSHERARRIFAGADYRPPAKKGDLLRLAADPEVRMVGLVDGVFLQDYPPTPIEVYQLARKQGVLLAGAASLGALRAVELEKFGMVGIGRVFQLYRSGRINADDEVAVTFAPEEQSYGLQSEKSIISRQAKMAIARVAKGIYFPHRNYAYIIEEAKKKHPSLEGEMDLFKGYIASNRKSLKEIDAIKLVEYLKERSKAI